MTESFKNTKRVLCVAAVVVCVLSRFFFKEKPVRTLAALAKKDHVWYANMLCKEIDCTYPHMIGLLAFFEQSGLVTSEAAGRIKIVKLTPQGEDLAHEFEGLLRRFDRLQIDSVSVPEADEFNSPQATVVEAPEPKKKRKADVRVE